MLRPLVELRTGREQVWSMPETCPECGGPVVRYPGEVAYRCENPACPAQLVRRVQFFVSRPAMDIEGFGAKQMEGFGEKKVENLLAALEDSKQQPATRLLTALGIHFVGGTVAELLLERFRSFDGLAQADEEALAAIDGIGPRIAESEVTWFAQPGNQHTVERLRAAGLQMALPEERQDEQLPLDGKTFVITGTLPTWSREQATALIKERGGRVTGSVSGKTDYLLAGERAGSKLGKAQKLGVTILTEADLRDMLDLQRP